MTDDEQRELLLKYRPWLRQVAVSRCSRFPHLAEDLAAEGWVEMWRAIPLWNPAKGTLDWWLKFKADGRMLTVLRNWSYNKNSMHAWVVDVPDFLSTAELPSSVEMYYHNGEIAQAIGNLTPTEREYIYLRFWKGYSYPELVDYFGYQPSGLKRRSFDKLRKELAHLGAE